MIFTHRKYSENAVLTSEDRRQLWPLLVRQAEDVVDFVAAQKVVGVLTIAIMIKHVIPAHEQVTTLHVPERGREREKEKEKEKERERERERKSPKAARN